jgi:lipid-A-disaccharide synthase-like uncharacterized protein
LVGCHVKSIFHGKFIIEVLAIERENQIVERLGTTNAYNHLDLDF